MIKYYLIERRSWISLFLCLQVLILFVAYIDTAIPFLPILYIVFLSMIIFIFFLVIRFNKETKFYKSLIDWENILIYLALLLDESPFEKIVESSITSQTDRLRMTSTSNLVSLEQEKDELLAWIHEVKTPLTAMHLMIDRIEESMKGNLTMNGYGSI